MEATVKTTEPSAGQLVFRFVSGHRALDFLATFADRHHAGTERLRQPVDLDRWLRAAGLPAPVPANARDLEDARRLREAINRLARASMQGRPGAAGDIDELNRCARRPPAAPQLDNEFRRRWHAPDPVGGALALIAREAVELLGSPERELIHECAAPTCSRLYLDRSRGRRRRWCEMERCGSRAKMAGFRQRQAASHLTQPGKRDPLQH
ncbi:MAG TPA: CGNR zinc finger domain-containing protein [Actinomycetota bacterium]|nr:CGNR zinc finger domain-containing protein [Actinomycetota bacterium]